MSIRRFVAAGVALSLTVPLLGMGSATATPTADPVVSKAKAWLLTQQEADGGFELADTPGFETSDAVLALATSFQTTATWDRSGALAYIQGLESGSGKDPLDALDDLVDNEADPTSDAAAARAAKIIVLVADPLGIDPADFDPSNDSASPVDLVTRVTSHQEVDGTYDLGALFNGVLYTTIALRTQGLAVPNGLYDQILDGQRPDGSWDYSGTPDAEFGGNDVDTTALALIALRHTGATTAQAEIGDAVSWLASVQAASGAWQAFGSDDPNSTSMASMALSDLHVDITTPAWRAAFGAPVSGSYTSPYTALRAMQRTDGRITSPNDGFGVNTFATTQSIQALSRQVFLVSEREALIAEWSQRLASPAAAPVDTNAVDLASDTLGDNPSVKGVRSAAATAVVTGQKGREAAATDLFKQAFNRSIDPSGRAYWSNKLVTITRPEMLARLTGSAEFYRKAGGTTPTFVDAVYQSVLGRAADPSGRAFWINQLNKGRSVESVARTLVASSEYRRTQVKNTFQRVLDRQPTTGERDYWTAKLASTRVEVLIAGLASSAEFYDVTIS
ncbi:MAG: Prenyltransferase [Ilumatobacteraceae bacterium]|nr:Prenyltransferase [Ilumatobacteraceae bacterium]